MVADDSDYQRHEATERAKRRDQDRDDLNNELAGRDVGRQKRFLPGDAQPDSSKSKRDRTTKQLSQLATMMLNAEYAVLYNETLDLVRNYASLTEVEIDAAQSDLPAAGLRLEEITDNAAKLHPDGEPVFMGKDGNAVRVDGTPLTPEEAESVVWPDNAPSYDDYFAAKLEHARAQQRLDAWREYQLFLADAQNRLNDPENPLSAGELGQLQEDIEKRHPKFGEVKAEPDQNHLKMDTQSAVSKPF